MSITRFVAVTCLVGGFIGIFVNDASAALISLVAVQDTYIGPSAEAALAHDDLDLLLAEGSSTVNVQPWMQFDLSSIPAGATINSAFIELYLVAASSSTTNTMTGDGYTMSDAAGTLTFDEATLSKNDYVPASAYISNELNSTIGDFANLGNSGALPALNQYYASASADANDLSLLQSIADNDGFYLIQIYRGNISGTHTRTFADREGGDNTAPRLVLDYTVPEPSTAAIAAVAVMLSLGFRAIASKQAASHEVVEI